MADHAVHHHRGDMEISEQVSTFKGFMGMTKWGSLAAAVGLVFLTLLFCARAGFFQAAGAAVVLGVLGVLFLRAKPAAGH